MRGNNYSFREAMKDDNNTDMNIDSNVKQGSKDDIQNIRLRATISNYNEMEREFYTTISSVPYNRRSIDEDLLRIKLDEIRRKNILNVLDHLTCEMYCIYNHLKPSDAIMQRRRTIFESFEQFFKSEESLCPMVFGSSSTGLFLPGADIDIVFVDDMATNLEKSKMLKVLRQVRKRLRDYRALEFGTFIKKAKVPILKYTTRKDKIPIDISFSSAIRTTQAITMSRRLIQELPGLDCLLLICKRFLYVRNLNSNSSRFGIGGYALLLWMASFMRLHSCIYPSLEGNNTGKCMTPEFFPNYGLEDLNAPINRSYSYKNTENPSVGKIFADFLHFFGYCYDYNNLVLAPAGVLGDSGIVIMQKKHLQLESSLQLILLDPADPQNIISLSPKKVIALAHQFREGFNLICKSGSVGTLLKIY
jgi:DNA polymerase sigma